MTDPTNSDGLDLGNPISVFQDEIDYRAAEQQKKEGARRFLYKEPYNLIDEHEGHIASATFDETPSLTEQHHAADADINVMMKRMGVTDRHPIPVVPIDMENVYDFTDVVDLQEAMNRIMVAKELFAQMPADVRARFNNNPAQMYRFIADDSNREEAERMGILREIPKAPTETKAPDTQTSSVSTST